MISDGEKVEDKAPPTSPKERLKRAKR